MNWTLLHKYLSNECNPEEIKRVENWLQADERNQRFLDSLRKIWSVKPDDQIKVDANAAWSSFQHKISSKKEEPEEKKSVYEIKSLRRSSSAHKTYSRSVTISLSAAVILIAFLFYQYVPEPVSNEAFQVQSFAMQEIVTTKGQQTSFLLSDGTRVQLNADSKLEIPSKFMGTSRRVYLKGEAYFEVSHDPDRPFLVHTGEAYTKVLGTKFGVRAYPEEDQIQVVVTEGKIALGSEKQLVHQDSKEIMGNQMGILAKSGKINVLNVENTQRYLGWKDGKLVFEDTPLREVRHQLERWFDITCLVADSTLGYRRITASFSGEPMTEVLNVIALSMDIRYERNGREVTFQRLR